MAHDLGDPSVVKETVEIFLVELPRQVGAMVGHDGSGELAELRSTAHSLKSAAAMLGALDLSRICAELESVPDPADGGGEAARRLCIELQAEAAAVEAAFADYLSDTV